MAEEEEMKEEEKKKASLIGFHVLQTHAAYHTARALSFSFSSGPLTPSPSVHHPTHSLPHLHRLDQRAEANTRRVSLLEIFHTTPVFLPVKGLCKTKRSIDL